ncbi:tRNA (adenosine(37)-N6)-threonylcarbamoyltransferase complex transferase subunit TsaD [Pasteuria penetrans]|uniref:tRNA (adenosine(37)-N6)-threonylcarbamoyltransferase complex transferase subunit TsaD n=1 Tax=Pasteuria penetrans TaxID=86005 RepID=UPI000F973A1C|nr:tRNA (adenosine(37)-N6)-threonylcarbamoyltransferase complex transferase subunit TsaD [Pasteuria penetrans]
MSKQLLLGIETSCDDTAVALVRDGRRIVAQEIVSQTKDHQKMGGVVPEVASRLHVEVLVPTLQKVLSQASVSPPELEAIAVTDGPGLVGSLLSGVMVAKTLAWVYRLPLVPVHHVAGHIYAAHLVEPLTFPLVALVVSGGHTELVQMPQHGIFHRLGKTRDDAAGEAFDKVARMLGLPYPGGPPLEELAKQGNPSACPLPRAWLPSTPLSFSFSGLKTAVWQWLQRDPNVAAVDVAASFQEAVIEVLAEKAMRALKHTRAQRLVVVGGVAANERLRMILKSLCEQASVRLTIPPPVLCTDNAAMIAAAGTYLHRNGISAPLTLTPVSQRSFATEIIGE